MAMIIENIGVEQELIGLDDQRRNALLNGDARILETLLADELHYIHSDAIADTKTSYLNAVTSGSLRYKQIELQDRQVQIYGKTATLTGIADMRVAMQGEERPPVHIRYATVWVKRDRWQMVLFSATAIRARLEFGKGFPPRPHH